MADVVASRASFDALPVDYRLDDYRIVAVLGKGGFGITYKAVDERLERQVAIKEYLPRDYAIRGEASKVLPRGDEEKSTFEWGLKRFVDEARALALFRHPNIISVLRYLEANGTAYLVMEYEEGEDLDHWLARRSNVTEAQLVTKILLPVLDGLEKVHAKQLLHRDIKPGQHLHSHGRHTGPDRFRREPRARSVGRDERDDHRVGGLFAIRAIRRRQYAARTVDRSLRARRHDVPRDRRTAAGRRHRTHAGPGDDAGRRCGAGPLLGERAWRDRPRVVARSQGSSAKRGRVPVARHGRWTPTRRRARSTPTTRPWCGAGRRRTSERRRAALHR